MDADDLTHLMRDSETLSGKSGICPCFPEIARVTLTLDASVNEKKKGWFGPIGLSEFLKGNHKKYERTVAKEQTLRNTLNAFELVY